MAEPTANYELVENNFLQHERNDLTMMIRKATFDDINELVKMRIAFLEAEHGCMTDEQKESLLNQLPTYYNKHIGEDLHAYFAEVDGLVVSTAFVIISEKPASLSYPSGKFATLLNVYTKPKYRRQGISKKLLAFMIEEIKKTDVAHIELKATKDGYPLYEKLGFKQEHSKYPDMKMKFNT